MGLWLCHTCTMKEKIAEEKEKSAATIQQAQMSPISSGISSQSVSQESSNVTCNNGSSENEVKEVENLETPEPMQVEDMKKEVDDEVTIEENGITKEEDSCEVPQIEEKKEELTPFEELIRVASLLNPKQFELPMEMTEPFPFPGSDRVEPIRNGRRVKNKRLIELDSHGCVPLPAKLCFACSKSCKKAPLISCDYCSLYFHQDCLDPPMTALPAGRWMCPNHPQHFIVRNLKFFL